MPDWKNILVTLKTTLGKHAPGILNGLGIAGTITAAVLAVKATPKALQLMERERRELNWKDKVKLCWKCYLPAVATEAVSVACLIGATNVSARRNAALVTAYGLSETALKDYREKVVETVGEKKEQAVRDAVAKDELLRNPRGNREVIVTGRGETMCYDSISGRYFYSSRERLEKAENEINRRLRDDLYLSLNEFYEEIGLSPIGVGDDLGWSMDHGYLEISFSTQLADDGATPCLVMLYDLAPEYSYK